MPTLHTTRLALTLGLVLNVCAAQAGQEGHLVTAKTTSLYDFTMDDIDGKPVNLSQYRGGVLLVVNTASLCGNTPRAARSGDGAAQRTCASNRDQG